MKLKNSKPGGSPVRPSTARGRIKAVCVSARKGVRKEPVEKVFLKRKIGVEGDAHAQGGKRQVSLLAAESIERQARRQRGLVPASAPKLGPGDFAENITVEGIELFTLPVGTILRLGETAVVEVSQIGKECHNGCEIKRLSGDCVMPREGIFARVREEGWIQAGDIVEVVSPAEARQEVNKLTTPRAFINRRRGI